nr:MAG TPA: hypothetical protein [Caudoviricetes sp.]
MSLIFATMNSMNTAMPFWMQAVTMGTQTSRATYSRLLVNSFIFGYSFHSVNLILQAVHPLITFDGGSGKAVVLPPRSDAGGNGQAGGHELFHLRTFDGQQGLPGCARNLICQSERQSSRAGQRSDGHFAIRHRAYLLSQVLVSARQCLPRCRAADAVHSQAMRLLRFHQGIFRPFSEQAISLQLQELLEHDRRTAVRVPGAAPADGGKHELVVGRTGVLSRRGAEPRRFRATGVGVDKGSTAVPVDADAAEPHGLSKDAQCHRVDTPILHPPVRCHAVAVLTARTAFNRRIMRDAAVARRDLQRAVHLVSDELELFGQLRVHRLLSAAAGTLELGLGKVLGERGLIPALERNDAQLTHLLKADLGKQEADKSANDGAHDIPNSFAPHFAIMVFQCFQPPALFFLLRHHAFHAQGQLLDRSGQCTHFAYAFLQQGDSSVLTGIFLFEPTLELLMLGSRNRLVHLTLLSFVIQKMRGAGSPDSPARSLDLDFEVLQDFLNLLPNQRRNLIEGLLALHNEGCIDDCHDTFLLSQ